ncbi:VPLPA-CTERM sorting domain-containing protein [Roseospira navarrensis]|uniref:VPLPA-CTERM sorting domain-containing protein n=1 Tax=Roseospira navarrensis TaxID=140058 RepID=A0A7X2D2Q7_9PROT|nr:VPLPA-CTERM sorting domain-containing protein [Roseospira navarrensis]MQX36519.1 hypothetical protein [Roseospira navarrensis]
MVKGILGAAGLAAVMTFGAAGGAQAAMATCPDTAATDDREFSLASADVASIGCYAFGDGNDKLDKLPGFTGTLLDKSDSNSDGTMPLLLGKTDENDLQSGLYGTFSFIVPTGYDTLYISFKSGQGGKKNDGNPDYAAFSVDVAALALSTLSFNWAIGSGHEDSPYTAFNAIDSDLNQALSHVSVYGDPSVVPLPAAGWFLLTALVGLAGTRWLNKGRAAA